MCIFTGPASALRDVAATSILARALEGGRQILVYSMRVTATEPLAMVLPLPIPPGTPEDAVRFIDMEGYPDFFADLDRAFPPPLQVSGGFEPQRTTQSFALLQVHDVGAFEASFVPSRADFVRLDKRFRLSDSVWDALPMYAGWGFAVFQLKDVAGGGGWLARLRKRPPKAKTIHPMAFEFPVRDSSRLFFPTVHVHDGQVHPEARFDHALYAQPLAGQDAEGQRSAGVLKGYLDIARAQGVVDGDLCCFKTNLRGVLPNEDTYVKTRAGESPPPHPG